MAAVLVRVCACKRLCERSCCGVLPRSSKACSMLACVQRHESYAYIACFVFRTHSMSRCCLYQATRDVDVAINAPAVSVVSEGGVLWGTESCAACVLWVYARFPHAALDNPRGLLSLRCRGTYTLNPHMLYMGYCCI